MTEKEKLIDLLCYIPGAEVIADFFLANGVTIPVRCKDCKYRKNKFVQIHLLECGLVLN